MQQGAVKEAVECSAHEPPCPKQPQVAVHCVGRVRKEGHWGTIWSGRACDWGGVRAVGALRDNQGSFPHVGSLGPRLSLGQMPC